MPHDTTPVILSGGSGTRLWPLSSVARPKQFHALVGEETLIQATVRRVKGEGTAPPIVVCNQAHVAEVVDQLQAIECPPSAVVVEPVGRNTAPAVAAAALVLDPETVMMVLPADHLISDEEVFRSAMSVAVEAAAAGSLVTFGVVPTRPDTGYGYIEMVEGVGPAYPVERFVEKPDAGTAASYVAAGYLWNSGMFVFEAGVILEEMRRHEPAVVEAVEAALPDGLRDSVLTLGESFGDAPSISLDHAVMERTDRAVVVPLDAGWTDVGSWNSVWETLASDGGTVTHGEVLTVDVERSYVRSESRPVAVIGLDDVIVIETPDGVLVMDKERSQDVRLAAEWQAQKEDPPGRRRARGQSGAP